MVSAHELNEMHGKKQFSLEQLHFLRLLTESPLTFASMLVVDLYSLPVFEHHRATAIAKLRNRSFQERIKRKALENMDEIGDGEKEEIILAHGIVSRKIADAEKRGVIPIGISGLRREKKLLGSIDAPELIRKLPEPKDVLEQLAQRLEKAKHLKDVSRRTEAQERPDAYRFAEHLTTPPRQEELTRYKAFEINDFCDSSDFTRLSMFSLLNAFRVKNIFRPLLFARFINSSSSGSFHICHPPSISLFLLFTVTISPFPSVSNPNMLIDVRTSRLISSARESIQ